MQEGSFQFFDIKQYSTCILVITFLRDVWNIPLNCSITAILSSTSMKATDDLYQLVKSLTPSEKRYFKVFSKRHVLGDVNKYEVLFDCYDEQPDDLPYDEDKLKKGLTDKKLGKNFADEKKNLHEMVMKAMRSFHAGVSIDNQLNELLTDEELYRSKRLNTLRRKAIDKGKEIAEKYEKYNTLLTLLEREEMMNLELSPDNLKEQAKSIGSAKSQLLEKIKTISKLREINDWFFIQYRIYAGKVPEDFWQMAEERMAEPVFKNYTEGFCLSADISYNKVWAIYYTMKGDHFNLAKYYSIIYDKYERQYPHLKASNTLGYKITMYNYIYSLNTIRDFDKMKALLDYAQTIPSANDDEAGEDFQNIALYKQLYYLNTSQFDQAIAMVNEINEGLKRHKKKVNKARELALINNISISYMMLEQWDQVVDYTERIICDKTDVRQDIKYEARINQLIARFEQEEYDQLSYQIRNTQRWIDSKNTLSHSYNNVLKLLNTLIKNGGKQHFKAMRNTLDESLLLYEGYVSVKVWLYSRVNHVSMQDAVKIVEN
ncbi:MAG: hypothetical protein JWO03_2960 [Bacteroidetes bacterium]|nr:hypothetical protein [Bacteroidota bacterium]